MAQDHQCIVSKRTGKRKQPDEEGEEEEDGIKALGFFSLDELNQDLLEKVLSWLPTSSFFRLRSVCKRWSCVATSASFRLACSQIPSRHPWFFMVDSHLDQSIIFDTSERNWKNLNYPSPLAQRNPNNFSSIPVAASGGLVCFRNTTTSDLVVCNPVIGDCREIPTLPSSPRNQTLNAISMHSYSKDCYKIVLIFGEIPHFSVRIYDSSKHCWEEEFMLCRKINDGTDVVSGDETLYFLSKAGDVVATNMQRSPSKQYSAVITVKDGEEIVYFLSSSGTVVACNLKHKSFLEYPRLLPVFLEYSIDVVECRGEMYVVVLSEFLESASLRVWKFLEKERSWRQVAAMPPSMSHDFYGKKSDINCVGSGDQILICVNSCDVSRYVLCDLVGDAWVELPKCVVNGKAKEFMSAFSFEPRIEACV